MLKASTKINNKGYLKIEDVLDLTGPDGNAFVVLATTKGILKEAGYSESEIDGYISEATRSDYNHLLRITNKYLADLTLPKGAHD